jgi:hypothetical protein
MTGDGHGPLLGEHAIATEIAGEFGGGHGLSFCHIGIHLEPLFMNIRELRENRKSRNLRKSQGSPLKAML